MGEPLKFIAKREDLATLRVNYEKIWNLFGVRLLLPADEECWSDKLDQEVEIGLQREVTEGDSPARLFDLVCRVQRYADSLCAGPWELSQRTCVYPRATYERLVRLRDEVERASCAVLRPAPQSCALQVSGKATCVAMALALLQNAAEDCESDIKASRCALELEDSSYDSDVDNSEGSVPTHEDISRTVSDTLGAEFAEYVGTGAEEDTSENTDPSYTQRVEFAVKLGYTERQVQVALRRLGSSPSQNELLAELIKLGALGGIGGGNGSSSTQINIQGTENTVEVAENRTNQTNLVELGREICCLPGSEKTPLRHVVVDGSNVAMSHGNKEIFSCRGIKLCVDWFRAMGHKDITVFVPSWRKETSRPDAPIKDQEILLELERDRLLVFTPSRFVGGKRLVCYDDRYILKLAVETDGIVVSNDNYRDLAQESPEFRKVIGERILMFSFVNDRFMPPDDPLGRNGPTLANFLRSGQCSHQMISSSAPHCPYGKKCTYGNKCKYFHPERGCFPHKSVTERLAESAQRQLQEVKARGMRSRDSSPGEHAKGAKSLSLPLPHTNDGTKPRAKQLLSRTTSSQAACSSEQVMWNRTRNPPPPTVPMDPGGGVNLHRKLQRQLTINPTFDARIAHLQVGGASFSQHVPLVRHASSGPGSTLGPPWEHAQVTRIASAPDPSRPWPTNLPPPPRLVSASEPQLYETLELRRQRLEFHLSSLFPQERVRSVMRIYPEETDPDVLCAAILSYPQ